MAGAAVGTFSGCPVAAAAGASGIGPSHRQCPANSRSSHQSLSHGVVSLRNGAKPGLIPSCLSSVVPSCRLSTYRRAFRLSSRSTFFAISFSCPALVGSGRGEIWGLAGGSAGESVQDLRRAATTRRNPKKADLKVKSMSARSEGALDALIQGKNSQNAVVVYSKTWCPYCSMVKSLFTKLGVPFALVELDQLMDEQDIQDALIRLTGQGTVPNVFIGGKHIGGCDDTMALHKRGELVPALEAAGLKVTAG